MADTPIAEAYDHGVAASKIIKEVIKNNPSLTKTIRGKTYLMYELWQTIGALFKLTPVIAWTQPVEKSGVLIGWAARAEIFDEQGKLVASAEGMCLNEEDVGKGKTWGDREEFTVRSMAQTRTAAKAFRMKLAWIAVLAGYEPTPAEEMEQVAVKDEANKTSPPICPDNKLVPKDHMDTTQLARASTAVAQIKAKIKELDGKEEDIVRITAECNAADGLDTLTYDEGRAYHKALNDYLKRLEKVVADGA